MNRGVKSTPARAQRHILPGSGFGAVHLQSVSVGRLKDRVVVLSRTE